MRVGQLQRLAIAPNQQADGQIGLTPEQQHYLGRVLRLKAGDRFIAMDGQEHWWLAQLGTALDSAQIIEAIAANTELPVAVTLLIAMPKGSGMEDIVRQVTELGVSTIVPVISDRTVINPSAQKLERWRRIAQEAAEQSERLVIPTLGAPQDWSTALQTWNATQATCYLCEARGNHPPLWQCLTAAIPANPLANPVANPLANPVASPPVTPETAQSSIVLAIGPEGGWTDAEIRQAIAAGYQPVSLGRRVLRAITAPAVALALVGAIAEPPANPHEPPDRLG